MPKRHYSHNVGYIWGTMRFFMIESGQAPHGLLCSNQNNIQRIQYIRNCAGRFNQLMDTL
jgi:hypothetical protein